MDSLYYADVKDGISVLFNSDHVVEEAGFLIDTFFVCDNTPPGPSIPPSFDRTTEYRDRETVTEAVTEDFTMPYYNRTQRRIPSLSFKFESFHSLFIFSSRNIYMPSWNQHRLGQL